MKILLKNILLLMTVLATCPVVTANQPQPSKREIKIYGGAFEISTLQPIPFATVALFDSTGTTLLGGTATSLEGLFEMSYGDEGEYLVRLSAIGYQTLLKSVVLTEEGTLNLDSLFLSPMQVTLAAAQVTGQRIKAIAGTEETTFLVSPTMQKASHTGVDILRLIPGVQTDIMQNITLEGSSNILILVDGRQRDKGFVSQLKASHIDRVEVYSTPPAQYDAGITGVINIITSKDSGRGLQGQMVAEVPLSASEVFIFPSYSLDYSTGKFNLFTSYNGEMSYFDIEEKTLRLHRNEHGPLEFISLQTVKQKNWSHRFHYGVDYLIDSRNQLNLYGFVNPYSQEHDGKSVLSHNMPEMDDWSALKEDHDRNLSTFFSLFYRHFFDRQVQHELTAEAGLYFMQGVNQTDFTNETSQYHQTDIARPWQQTLQARLDYQLPLWSNTLMKAGIHCRTEKLQNEELPEFFYGNRIIALHGSVNTAFQEHFQLTAGIRYEHSNARSHSAGPNAIPAWLPVLSASYQPGASGKLTFSLRKTLNRPEFYQLNPTNSMPDPFTLFQGNPDLQPERHTFLRLNYSHRFENHFISAGFFYHRNHQAIHYLGILGREGIMQYTRQNMGTLTQAGIEFSGALSAGKAAGINPSVRIFQVLSDPNKEVMAQDIRARRQLAFSATLSAFAHLGKDFTASVIFKYSSPVNEIQANYYEGAQYFLSLEKDFGQGIKGGIVSAVPLAGGVVYRGSETNQPDWYNRSEGQILTSAVPLWLKFSYQFSSGTRRDRIERRQEEIRISKRKGF